MILRFCAILAIFAAISLILGGCQVYNDANRIMSERVMYLQSATDTFLPAAEQSAPDGFNYTLLVEQDDIAPAMHEPRGGVLLGVNPAGDSRANNITAFEQITGREHDILSVVMHLDCVLPMDELLTAMFLQKAVLLTIHPPMSGDQFNAAALQALAGEIGEFNMPVFVNLFPYSRYMRWNPRSFRNFYRSSARAFRSAAPKAAMVWSACVWDAPAAMEYFPGHAYVDWVGLEISLGINANGQHGDFYPLMSDFLSYFQHDKPIMISGLSVSHFTTTDNTYRTEMAADALTHFYSRITSHWPRVKAIVINSFSEIDPASRGRNRNNFLISSEEAILQAYQQAVAAPALLPVSYTHDIYRQFTTHIEAVALYNDAPYIIGTAAHDIFMNLPRQARRRIWGHAAYNGAYLAGRVGAVIRRCDDRGMFVLESAIP